MIKFIGLIVSLNPEWEEVDAEPPPHYHLFLKSRRIQYRG
jgi:hypothetical protein